MLFLSSCVLTVSDDRTKCYNFPLTSSIDRQKNSENSKYGEIYAYMDYGQYWFDSFKIVEFENYS